MFQDYYADLAVQCDKYSQSPLHFAAYFGHVAVVESLLQGYAASNNLSIVNALDHKGRTALHYAVKIWLLDQLIFFLSPPFIRLDSE